MKNERQKRGRVRWTRVLLWICVIVITTAAVCLLLQLVPNDELPAGSLLDEPTTIKLETEPETPEYVKILLCQKIAYQLSHTLFIIYD